jgi:hypothetical protein
MKKETSAPEGAEGTSSAADTTAKTTTTSTPAETTDAPTEVTDEAAKEGENHFDANHEWPTKGGCYIRQADGTLKQEG